MHLIDCGFVPSQIYVSNKWGFTKWLREDYKKMQSEGKLQSDGVVVQYIPEHGPLDAWKKRQSD